MISTKTEQRETKGTVSALGLLVVAFMAAWVLLAADPAHAVTTFTVNQTSDLEDTNLTDNACDTLGLLGRQCTLRAAIQQANATANSGGPDLIKFAIFGDGPHTIQPSTQLPTITRPVTIDGYSQSGATENTLTQPGRTNAVPMIELRGPGTDPDTDGFMHGLDIHFDTSNVAIKGLVINNFSRDGIRLGSTNSRVEGNFIGTDPSVTSDQGNGSYGVSVGGANNIVGGTTPAARNLISGNNDIGVVLSGGSPSNNKAQGNLIGTTKDGTDGNLGNGGAGVSVGSNLNPENRHTVGDDDPSDGLTNAANTIAFNEGDGVRGCSGNILNNFIFSNGQDGVTISGNCSIGGRILRNSIYNNGELGIDLLGGDETSFGVTRNDRRDPDTGNNALQNFPAISSATTASGGPTTITGGLNSTPNKTFTIQFFSSPAPDPSGFGEGKTFIGQRSVTTNANGTAPFSFEFARGVPVSWRVTATATPATVTGAAGTSEFSRACIVTQPPP
jgi:hypothetical protein